MIAPDSGVQANLVGSVRIVRARSSENRPIVINTEDLTIFPKKGYFQTQKLAKIRSLGSSTDSVGLIGNTETNELELNSQVITVHEPIIK